MNDDERSGRDPIITHDDGDVIELPGPGGATGGDAARNEFDDDGLLAQQTPGLDADATRRAAGTSDADWPGAATGDAETE